jgi:PAS domain S-box-containing protein
LVLGAAVRLLTSPLALKMAMLLLSCAFAFVMALIVIRSLRRNLAEEGSLPQTTSAQIPLQAYHAVIHELKQQKQELSSLRDAELRHSNTAENISAAVVSKLPIGIVFFAENGLVRQANPAAKTILGIASLTAMDAASVFAKSSVLQVGGLSSLVEGIRSTSLQGESLQEVEAEYFTPSGERRIIAVTSFRAAASDGEPAGVACLILDRTEITELRRQIDRQLGSGRDSKVVIGSVEDFSEEANHLDSKVGGFLADNRNAEVASSHS